MPDLGPHAVFIVSAYIGVALITSALVIAVVWRARAARRRLARLESRGSGDRTA